MVDWKVKYVIEADGRQAKAEVREVDAAFDKIGGAVTNIASGPVGVGLAGIGTALLAVTAAAVTAGVALFELTKSASEFGSEIFDASKKTGLHAETLSAMKLAADQSGSSLEAVTAGIAKFSKEVGAAADGSDKAAKKLEAFGLDPQEAIKDLDGALAKVFKRIQDAPPGIERMTLAQKAFGKSGADLLPFIDSFNGDLEQLVKHAKALGVTLDDEAAKAADEFGDSLDTLNAQLAGVGREIAGVFMPTFTRMIQTMSEGLAQNSENLSQWADRARMHILGVEQILDGFASNLENFRARTGKTWIDIATDMLDKTGPMIGRLDQLNKLIGVAANEGLGKALPGVAQEGYATARLGGYDGDLGGTKRGSGKDPAAEAERIERERVQAIRKNLTDEINLRAATDRTKLAQLEAFYAEGTITEEQFFERSQKLTEDQQLFRIRAYNDTLALLRDNAEEEERLRREIAIVEQQAYTESYRLIKDKADFEKKVAKDRWDEEMRLGGLLIDRYEQEKKIADELERQAKATREQLQSMLMMPGFDQFGNETARAPEGSGGGFFDGLFGPDGLDIIRDEAMELEQIYRDMGTMVADVTGQMAAGVGALVEAWVLYGDLGPNAVRKMVAAVLAGVAAEAAVKAVFQLAEGFAALFFNPAEAAAHFKAAALYGAVAVGAGLAGRAIAGDSFKSGGSSRGGSSSRSSSSSSDNLSPISKQNENTFVSGRGTVFNQMNEAINGLVGEMQKLKAMKAGELLTKGIKESPGTVGNAVVSDIKRNSAVGSSIVKSSGMAR